MAVIYLWPLFLRPYSFYMLSGYPTLTVNLEKDEEMQSTLHFDSY